jgi:hypothetical protein
VCIPMSAFHIDMLKRTIFCMPLGLYIAESKPTSIILDSLSDYENRECNTDL